MSIGMIIQEYRKKLGMTQESLAQTLGVTNQAVSKWETDQSVPDTMLLPVIADVLGVSIDALFEREMPAQKMELPWEDDEALRVVVYCGHSLVGENPMKEKVTFRYEGPVRDIYCDVNVECDEVGGNVTANGNVDCSDVSGSVMAGGYVECDSVGGNVNAGSFIECDHVGGNVNAGSYVECDTVGGSVTAHGYVECESFEDDGKILEDVKKATDDLLGGLRGMFGK